MTDRTTAPGARAATPVLSVRRLVKHYGATAALAGVDLEVHAGEVVGLIGANGAGKSTLIKVLAGAEQPTSGALLVDGVPVRLHGPIDAVAQGVATVHQDVDAALVPTLTVAENLVLADLARPGGGVRASRRAIRARAARLVPDGFPIDLDARVEDLSTSAKQQVLLARALAAAPRVLVLDEPTAALSVLEQQRLLADVRRLAAAGTAVVFISHHLAEVTEVSDRVVALREGEVVGTFTAPFDGAELVRAILGDLASAARTSRAAASDGVPFAGEGAAGGRTPVLSARGVRAWPGARPVDLVVHRGEVLGLTGLLGAGKTELLEQLVGARPLLAGDLEVEGRTYRPRHPADAVAAGLGFVPEDRVRAAEIPDWDVTRTVTLPDLRRVRRRGLLDSLAERAQARAVIDALAVVCSGPRALMSSLSGGNRQKVVVGRWIAAGARLLVLDEPFRGVDLGARADIAALLRSGEVQAAIVASSDPEEVLEVADRVLVLAGGTVVGEVRPGEVDADGLAALLAGATGDRRPADRLSATGSPDDRSSDETGPTPHDVAAPPSREPEGASR
ncbi:sugar ABC transporter ATP-binding protein [Cellulomonas soli]|uniref:Sugar ABC transporter ATP-binding protein n=1 Tax=Cellulomonas soli TaxID=931535 RepID=A0A512PFY7_9CELL|nr:sugar ABC transporter ATP-binding protein [Cellulomonas soli]NYI59730.1 simple sugar transport system ATP-binding protein [Cellulomonas soli]GEP70127.1 sugar ABC transporter ATP-binding protein [Cellulomonas soli]